MPADDLGLIVEAAHDAGEIARRHFGSGPKTWDKPGGHGPVTEADIEIDRMLHDRLRAARPDYGWLSEETEDDGTARAQDTLFIVDPIDGTRAFIAGEKSFAHSIAVTRAGRPVAGVVHLPMLGQTFTATAGGGAHRNGAAIRAACDAAEAGARVLAARSQLHPDRWPGGVPPVDRHFRPSLAWRLCLVAEGAFDGMFTLRESWDWDLAAGALIVAEAGGKVADRNGASLQFNRPDARQAGVLAGGAGLVDALLARLRTKAPA